MSFEWDYLDPCSYRLLIWLQNPNLFLFYLLLLKFLLRYLNIIQTGEDVEYVTKSLGLISHSEYLTANKLKTLLYLLDELSNSKVEQSLPAHLIFPIPTEMSWKRHIQKDVSEAQKNEEKKQNKTKNHWNFCPGKSKKFICIPAYVETQEPV